MHSRKEQKKRAGRPACSFSRPGKPSYGPLYLVRTQTSCTDVNVARGTVNDRLHTLDVGLPRTVRPSVGVGDLDPERDALAADIALCHWLHLLATVVSNIQSIYYQIAGENASPFQKFFPLNFPVCRLRKRVFQGIIEALGETAPRARLDTGVPLPATAEFPRRLRGSRKFMAILYHIAARYGIIVVVLYKKENVNTLHPKEVRT